MNSRITKSLTEIEAALKAEDIKLVLLKGAALIDGVYHDLALRPMSDLDILVANDSIDYSYQLLQRLGYTHEAAAPELPENHHHYPSLLSPDKLIEIEGHRHLVPLNDPFQFDLSGFWTRARHTKRGHLVPAPEDMLLHLCLHFFRNRRKKSLGALGQVTDIAEVMNDARVPIDWSLLRLKRARHRLEIPVFLGLWSSK